MQTFCLTFFGMKLRRIAITESYTRYKTTAIVRMEEYKSRIFWFNMVAMHEIKLIKARV